jgi:hypothetical protein
MAISKVRVKSMRDAVGDAREDQRFNCDGEARAKGHPAGAQG